MMSCCLNDDLQGMSNLKCSKLKGACSQDNNPNWERSGPPGPDLKGKTQISGRTQKMKSSAEMSLRPRFRIVSVFPASSSMTR